MFELQEQLQRLINWTVNTYGISVPEAIRSIEVKLNEIKNFGR